MPTLERERPPRLTGEQLVAAHMDYFISVTEAQLHPEHEGVIGDVRLAANRIERCLGPFVSAAVNAAVAFEGHYYQRRGVVGQGLDGFAQANMARINADGVLLDPIKACSFAPVPMPNRRFMLDTAGTFGKDTQYAANAITAGRAALLANIDRSMILYGLTEKDIELLAKDAHKSIGRTRWGSYK